MSSFINITRDEKNKISMKVNDDNEGSKKGGFFSGSQYSGKKKESASVDPVEKVSNYNRLLNVVTPDTSYPDSSQALAMLDGFDFS